MTTPTSGRTEKDRRPARQIPPPEGSGVEQHAAWIAGTFPEVEDLAGGTFSIPVPMPDSPLRYTLSYLLVGDGEAVVVDPGWDSEQGMQALVAGLDACGVPAAQVTGIVITHIHPDHHGLSRRLAALSGAWIGMHTGDNDLLADRRAVSESEAQDTDLRWLRRLGVPAQELPELALTAGQLDQFRGMPAASRLIGDGDLIPLAGRNIRAVWTPGHTPGHLCLHDQDADLLFTGDHLLPRISPNIGTHSVDEQPPLARYLDSLQRLTSYDSAEALPAHEWRFRGIASRVAELIEHHDQRNDEVVQVLGEQPRTVWDTATRLTWSRGWDGVHGFMRRAALAETVSHLVYLTGLHRIQELPAGPGGTVTYQAR